MKEFLTPTKYCDSEDASIAATIEATRQAYSGREAAVRLFRFVRDEVRYAFGPWGIPASTTLMRRQGTCSNKSNLLVALFRAAGFPAAYGVMRVDGQEYFGNINPPFFKHLMSRFSVHVYAAAWLDGRWIKCDPSTDRELAENTSHFCQQTRLVEWDGKDDSLDILDPRHVHADLGLRASLDELLERPARNATAATCAILNAYVRFIRSMPPFPSAEALFEAYLQHLGRDLPGRAGEQPGLTATEGACPAAAVAGVAAGRTSGAPSWQPGGLPPSASTASVRGMPASAQA